MSLRTSATRYARALFDVALKESDIEQVRTDLDRFVATVQGHADLRRVLTGAAVPRAVRMGVVKALGERMALASPLARLVELLADRGRLELLPVVAAVYGERLLAHRNIVPAQVISATPLAPDKLAALTDRLAKVTGKQVQVTATVDAALIGGLVAQIASTVYDGSVRTQLNKMRQQLVEGQ